MHIPGIGTQKKVHVVAVAFAGSASAGAAICVVGDGPVRVIAAAHQSIPLDTQDEAHVAAAVAQLCTETCDQVSKAYAASPVYQTYGAAHATYGFVYAPWVDARMLEAERAFEHETVISETIINEVGAEALASVAGKPLVESSVVRVELNGYATATPKGKRAHHIRVAALVSAGDQSVIGALTSALQRSFGLVPRMRSDTRVLLTALHEVLERSRNSVVVHVTGDTTLLVSVRKGAPDARVVVHEGMRTILRRAAGNTPPETTLSIISLAARDACTDTACTDIENALAQAEPELAKAFGAGFASMAETRRLPDTLILLAHPDVSSWLASFFARIDFAQFTVTTRPFTVDTSATNALQRDVAWEAGVPPESALVEAAAFVNSEITRGD